MANSSDVEKARSGVKDLRGVDLSGAKLEGVDLREVDLTGADWRDVNVEGVIR